MKRIHAPSQRRTVFSGMHVTAAILLLLCHIATGCADAARPTTAPSGTPMQRIKVLTYNTLHGLEPSGLTVKPSESKEVRQARLKLQFEQSQSSNRSWCCFRR